MAISGNLSKNWYYKISFLRKLKIERSYNGVCVLLHFDQSKGWSCSRKLRNQCMYFYEPPIQKWQPHVCQGYIGFSYLIISISPRYIMGYAYLMHLHNILLSILTKVIGCLILGLEAYFHNISACINNLSISNF